MSELESPTLILGNDDEDSSNDLVLDTAVPTDTTPKVTNRVSLSSLNKVGNHRHQEILPKAREEAAPVRKEISIDTVASPDLEDQEAHLSPIDDMVGIDNPNSLFSQYINRKEQEATEWITEREEEKQILEEEKELELDINDSSESNVIGADIDYSPSIDIKGKRDEDIDLSGLLDDPKEEIEEKVEENMMSREEENITVDTEDIDSLIDKDELPDADEAVKVDSDEEIDYEDAEEEAEEEEVVEEKAVIGKVEEKEYFDAPDMDLEEQEGNFEAAPIEEDDDDETDSVGEVDNDEVLKNLQKLATERLKPVSKKLDISSFTVVKKPASNINPIFQAASARVVKWVLPAQESTFLMKEFSGSELEKLREYSENSRSVDALNRRFHMIYDHIASPKPATFEQWLKSTPYEDVDHYFFGVYIASFKGANYLPEDCVNDSCKETFITDDINIMDMVKFDTTEAKQKFVELYQSEATPAGKGVYCTEIVAMTDKIAIAFRQPSIYNLIEIASLDQKTRTTYAHIIDYIPYIDAIYSIDAEAKTLTPITYKTFPDNAQRTVRAKLNKYDSIFSIMSVDEFGPVKAYVRAITEKSSGLRYVYPAVECPKCHTMTTEQAATAEELVFTRYQLGSLVTTSLS